MIILKISGLLFWLLVIPVGLGLLFRKAPRREHLPERLRTTGVTFINWIFIIVCSYGDRWDSGNAAIRLSWLFQNGDFVCSSADLRGRSRLWVLDIPGEEDTEIEPVRCLKGNKPFLMATKGSL